ncbi:hypothetical protein ACVIGB_009141 [Bradyrhizobium sp. USDA 4341]
MRSPAARDNRISPNPDSEIRPSGVVRERVRRPSSAVPLQPARCHQLSTRWIDALYGTSLAEEPLGKLALGKTWLFADYTNYLLGYRHRVAKRSIGGRVSINEQNMTSYEKMALL